MIIAIDGPAASGKGTLGKRLATHFGLCVPMMWARGAVLG